MPSGPRSREWKNSGLTAHVLVRVEYLSKAVGKEVRSHTLKRQSRESNFVGLLKAFLERDSRCFPMPEQAFLTRRRCEAPQLQL